MWAVSCGVVYGCDTNLPRVRTILIDDNVFTRSEWQKALSHLDFLAFPNYREFSRQFFAPQSHENTLVFLDYELNDGSSAKDNVPKLLALGFKNIFLTTAYDSRAIEPIVGISGILTKEPPNFLLAEKGRTPVEQKVAKIGETTKHKKEKRLPSKKSKNSSPTPLQNAAQKTDSLLATAKIKTSEHPTPPLTMKAQDLNLKDILEFRPLEGKILVGSDRMLLFRKGAFATLRNMIIDQVGPTLANSILTKFAFRNGQEDYHLLAKMFRWETEEDRLAAGPMMHAWSGIVSVEPTFMQYNRVTGHFHFKGIWKNSYEAEIHLETFGKSSTPVCSTLTGYGSGWCSAFFGSPVLEIETKCVACGDEHCEWEIRGLKDWGEEVRAQKEALYNSHDSIFRQLDLKSQDLNLLNRDLEKIIQEKTERNRYLVRVLCHDLLPPLEVVEEIIQLNDTEMRHNPANLSRLQTSVAALRSSLDAVRESQVEEVLTTINHRDYRELVGIEDITKYVNAVFHYKLQQKNLKIDVKDNSSGGKIEGNRITILQQIFQNLFSNAIKFSPRDSVIEMTAETCEQLVISIRDRGIGIPKNQRDIIFKTEFHLSRAGTQGEPGTGFGLAIANYSVKQLGGSIEIDSTTIDESFDKSGTKVIVRFPMK